MDQDVEAILNASDSEGDENLNVQGVSLEDILREEDGGEAYLLDGTSGGNYELRGDSPQRFSNLPDIDLARWRNNATEAASMLAYRGAQDIANSGDLNLMSGVEGAHGKEEHPRQGLPAAAMSTGSDILSGDSYDELHSGGPPRTAFLTREESTEDSRLLQQILKESEEEIAASAADRARILHVGRSNSADDVGVGAGGGSGFSLSGIDGLPGVGLDEDGNVDALESLDVDKIIESMELEAEMEEESSMGIPWRTRRRSGDAADAQGNAGSINDPQEWGDARRQVGAVSRRNRLASPSARSGSVEHAGQAKGRISHDPSGEPSLPLKVFTASDAGADPSKGRRRKLSPGRRVAGILPASGGLASGDVKGAGGGGDGGLSGPLAKAEAAELRLLRGGNREMISPLQVKRRMRAPPPSPPPGQASLTSGLASGVGGGAVGVVRMENLDAASRQLARNAAYGKHGPGVCTAMGAHSKFIAVGTSRGLILLFDHFQEIRHVLGSAARGGADGVPVDDPVTSLDMCVGCDCLVAGHGSGRVLLWDFLRCMVLRVVADVHSSAVVSVRCFVQGGGGAMGGIGIGGVGSVGGALGGGGGGSDPAVITADVEGVVNKLCFRRVMWSKWVVDAECLLDGAAGPIPALCVLPSWIDASASGTISASCGASSSKVGLFSGSSPSFHDLGLMAMSSWKNTFVVGIHPEVKVIHKWPRPPLPGAAENLPSPCLSWGPPQSSAPRPRAAPMALLARGWGNAIQILAATRVDLGDGDGGSSIGGAGRGGSGTWTVWPRLDVVKELTSSAPVVAVEWLREQVLAYLDAEMELCVLDTRAGAELEHASLASLGVALSPLLPPPPSSQPSPVMGSRTGPEEGSLGRGGAEGGVPGDRGQSSPAPCSTSYMPPKGTYHNAFRACEGRLYLLGSQELRAVRVQGWSQRVDSLVQAGEWLEALAVALDHYEQKILPAEIAAASSILKGKAEAVTGVAGTSASVESGSGGGIVGSNGGLSGEGAMVRVDVDVRDGVAGGDGLVGKSRRGGLSDEQQQQLQLQQFHLQQQRRQVPRSEAAEHINDLLTQYLRLAINNAPAAESLSGSALGDNDGSASGGVDGSRINLAHSHFQMLAGVCTEFCAVTGRLDTLFGQVFIAFRARGQQGVFLDTLEPCVLAGKLKMLSPDVLHAFVERCQSGGDMISAERLILRLEPRSIDLAKVLSLVRMHRLYTALLAVRALRGDFATSAEEVIREVIAIAERDQSPFRSDSAGTNGGVSVNRETGAGTDLCPYPADPTFDELGYKILLYIKRCFRGRVLGISTPLSEVEIAKARANLLHLLLRSSLSPVEDQQGSMSETNGDASTQKSLPGLRWGDAVFPYLSILLYVDAGATLDVLSMAMDSPEAIFLEEHSGGGAVPSPGAGGVSKAPMSVPAVARELSTSPCLSESSGRGWQQGGRASGGGVWGRRLGRGRARAIGWATGSVGSEGAVGAAGAESRAGGGRSVTGGEFGRPRTGEGLVGHAGAGAGAGAGSASSPVCPSRRAIVEAVARVLAPYLAELDSAADERSNRDNNQASLDPETSNLGEDDPAGAVPASAFVHDTHGSLRPESGSQVGKLALGDSSVHSASAGRSRRASAGWSSRVRDRDGQEWWGAARHHLLDFVAKYLELSLVMVGPKLTNAVLVSVAERGGSAAPESAVSARDSQARLVTLLQRVPLSLVDRTTLLPLAEKSRYFRAAVILLKAAVSLGEQRGFSVEQFARIVRCYLQDSEDAFRSQVFGFIRQEVGSAVVDVTLPSAEAGDVVAVSGGVGHEGGGGDAAAAQQQSEKRNIVLAELPRLMELNKAEAVFTVGEAFRGDHKAALEALKSTTTLQFEYLDALLRPNRANSPPGGRVNADRDMEVSTVPGARKDGRRDGTRGWSATSPQSASPALRSMPALASGLDDGDRSLHVRLLVKFRPYEVYSFLSTTTGYSLDDTLALCQERGVADATAYLLERKGDVTGALSLALRTLSSRLSSLRAALQDANLRDVAAEMTFVSPGSPSKRSGGLSNMKEPGLGHGAWVGGGSLPGLGGGSGGGGGSSGAASGTGPRAGTAAWARWASKVALEGLQEGREATRSLTVAIEMCQRASPPAGAGGGPATSRSAVSRQSTGGGSPAPANAASREGRSVASVDNMDDDDDLDLSASLWFQTLDKILSAKGAASRGTGPSSDSTSSKASGTASVGAGSANTGRTKKAGGLGGSGELPQTAAVMQGVLDALLQRTLGSMAGYVPLPVIVKKVVNDHAGNSLGEFRHVILAMLDTYSYDTAIHRTAASLLFESLRTAVRERHTLKGAGVRVCAVAGQELSSPRMSRAASSSLSANLATRRDSVARVEGEPQPADGAANVTQRRPPLPRQLPLALLEAVGSGVICVSTGGAASIEHLGRGSLGGSDTSYAFDASGISEHGQIDALGTAQGRAGLAQHDSQASVWRLRAARRRRQARGEKMRSLIAWATGEDPEGHGATKTMGNDRGIIARAGLTPGGSRGKTPNRSGARGLDGANPRQTPQTEGTSRGGDVDREREQRGLDQGLGWGVKLQARALAIPASFLPKRT